METGYRSEMLDSFQMPEDKDVARQFPGRPGDPFSENDRYEDLRDFWKEVTAVGDPFQYGAIGRILEDEDHASEVHVYFPCERREAYELEDGELNSSVKVSIMDEEDSQHGFKTMKTGYSDLPNWLHEIFELEDGRTWIPWDGSSF